MHAVHAVSEGEFVQASRASYGPVAYDGAVLYQGHGAGGVARGAPHALTERTSRIGQFAAFGAFNEIGRAAPEASYRPQPVFPDRHFGRFQIYSAHFIGSLPLKNLYSPFVNVLKKLKKSAYFKKLTSREKYQ
jgi:hypothetical protein